MSNFPTLDGLNNIEADSGNLTNITCETFIATVSAQAPTMIAGNISNNVATTAFVDDAINTATANLVTTDTTQTLTSGTKYFTNNPQSLTSAAPTLNNEYTNKKYVDDQISTAGGSFVTTGTTQTITGNKTFWPTTGTTVIRGTQADIFADTTFLTGNTTTISGVNANITSTTNYVGGTTTTLASTTVVVNDTCNSFYVDASYSNFVGPETLLQSPYTTISSLCNMCEVNPVTLRLQSPTIDLQNTCSTFTVNASTTNITGTALNISSPTTTISGTNCNITSPSTTLSGTTTTLSSPTINVTGTALNISSPTTTISGADTNFTGTNTNLTGTIATATTQSSSDNSTKLATTAFVNSYATANYMTLTTNQSVSGIKTYSTKQVFNAGTACNTYDATGVTDMTLASNNGDKGILTIADGRIITDSYGVRIAETRNLQLNEGTFIQPIPPVSGNDYSTPEFVFGTNKTQGYSDIVGVPNSAEATIQINNLAGIFSWFAGYNQTTTFTISHSIITTSTAIASMNEAEVVFYFQDFNTGITRYTTPNLATTTAFALPASSTVVRPSITFTLTTAQLPEGDYRIYGYSRVTNAYVVNAGVLTVNFGLPANPNTNTSVQNYNTPVDYTFTSRNLYHCFRNYVAGVYHVNVIAGQQNIIVPIFYSLTYYVNMFTQASTSGALTTPAVTGGTVAGNWGSISCNNADNFYIVYPNYSIIVYNTQAWAGTIYLNFKNTTNNPVVVAPTTISAGSSCKIYFDEVELLPY